MKTKAYVRFLNRAEHYSADIELVDVSARVLSKRRPPRSLLFEEISATSHPTLAKRKATDQGRKLALTHLKASIASAHIKDLYEDVGMYLRDVLSAATRHGVDAGRLIGEHEFKTDANTILKLGNWERVVQHVADSLFRKLENERSTKELLRQMDKKLGLGIAQEAVDAALPYLDARHVLVHDDGVVDADYAMQHKGTGLLQGDAIPLNYQFVTAAGTAILALVKEIDSKIISKKIVGPADTQP